MKQELRVDRKVDLNEFASIVLGSSEIIFDEFASGICLDTRVIKPGDLFFAIKSQRDGHDFAKQAMENGASACVVSRDLGIKNQILVSDTLAALWAYAGWVRSQWNKPIVALSGSNGKTSTKEMIAKLLGVGTLKTPGTWNNFLGVPLTLFMLRDEHQYGVIEMGINHFGELLQLCRFTKPNVALLTNVGPAHLEGFKDLDGVAKAKGEIFQQLQSSDTAIVNIDDPKIQAMQPSIRSKMITVSQNNSAGIMLTKKKRTDMGYELKIKYVDEEISVQLPVFGDHNISNYLCSLGVAEALNIPSSQIVENTSKIQPVDMRMQELSLSEKRKLINDCYNANPGSLSAALQTVSENKPKRFLLLVGDMLEMGVNASQIHRDMGKTFSKFGVHHVFVVGQFAADVVQGALEGGLQKNQVTLIEKKEEAAAKILPNFLPGDILLVKGSRGMKLEDTIQELQDRLKSD